MSQPIRSIAAVAAVLLDADGTLIRSGDAVTRSYVRWADEFGVDAARAIEVSHGRRSVDAMRELVPADLVGVATARLDELELVELDGIVPVPGAVDLLSTLVALRVPHAVVTSGSLELVTARLRAAGLPLPKVTVTAEQVPVGKPNPACFRLGAEALGVPAEACLVIEDAVSGVIAGISSGAQVIGVSTTETAEVLEGAGALHIVADLRRLRVAGEEPLFEVFILNEDC